MRIYNIFSVPSLEILLLETLTCTIESLYFNVFAIIYEPSSPFLFFEISNLQRSSLFSIISEITEADFGPKP